VLEYLCGRNHIERRRAERCGEPIRADGPQLEVESQLARTDLCAFQASDVDADEI
jgi:hypothetical protein